MQPSLESRRAYQGKRHSLVMLTGEVYHTEAVEENGDVRSFKEVYGQDASIKESLAAGRLDESGGLRGEKLPERGRPR